MPGSTYSKVQDTTRAEVCTKSVGKLRKLTATSRGLQNLLGADPMTALAVEAFGPGTTGFRPEYEFAVWLGFDLKQHSSMARDVLAG